MSEAIKKPASAEGIIQMQDVNKWYGQFHVLKDINLNVQPGERIVLCGPSGSGKSTTIRCLNRLEEHQQGRIVVDGVELTNDIKQIETVRREVGMVFQHFNLFPHLTILQNCTLAPMWVRKMPKRQAEEIAMHYLERVRIPEQAHKYPGQLSGGQQQRVGIARGMATNPPVLLCDEPTSALDASSTKQVMGLLQKLRDESGVTVVIITHEMEVVRDYCDSVTLLEHGRVVQSGPIAKVLESPDSALAEDLVPRPNIDGVEIPDGKALLDISFTSSPGVPTGATVLNLVASLGADVAAGRFESIGEVQVGRLAITVPAYHSNAIRGQLERNAILVREWV